MGLCFVAESVGRRQECDPQSCPFYVAGGRALPGGCLLERLMPREDWDAELAERWLGFRASLTAAARPSAAP